MPPQIGNMGKRLTSLEAFRAGLDSWVHVSVGGSLDLLPLKVPSLSMCPVELAGELAFVTGEFADKVRTYPIIFFRADKVLIHPNGLPEVCSGIFRPVMRSEKFLKIVEPSILAQNEVCSSDRLKDLSNLSGSFLIGPLETENYCHWVTEGLPKLLLYKEIFGHFPDRLIIPGKPKAFHAASLALLGAESEVRYLRGRRLHAGQVWFCTSLARSVSEFHPVIFDLLGRIPCRGFGRDSVRVFVSRKSARFRRILNENELLSALRPLGFQFVSLEELSFSEQVNLFRSAEVVIGPHGAGLANLVFSDNCLFVMEIFSPGFSASSAFAHICRHKSISYFGTVGSRAVEYTDPNGPASALGNRDFWVDVKRVSVLARRLIVEAGLRCEPASSV